MKRALCYALFAGVLSLAACSDKGSLPSTTANQHATVVMRDGTRLAGIVMESSPQEMKINGDDGSTHVVRMDQVRSVAYDPPATEAKGDKQPDAAAAQPPQSASAHEEHYHPPATAIQSRTADLPVGTEISVRLEESIDSGVAVEGQAFAAEIAKDVVDKVGAVAIPDGANASIVIKSASKGGRFRGAADLLLDLQSVSIAGRRYQLGTIDVTRKGRDGVGANQRTAVFTGAGAAIGAVIGAIAGGGKGAAIGAASGAGAGALAQVVTKGDHLRVPAETILTFKLDEELKVAAR